MFFLKEDSQICCDVIVVLGAAIWKDGRPSPALRRRVLHAVALMKQNKANFLLVTGGLGKYPPTEGKVMKNLAINGGISQNKIVAEEKGTSTFKSAIECIKIMRKNNWLNAIIVSDPYHLFRSVFVFRCFGINAVGSGAQGGREANPLWKWWYYHLRELIALPWYTILVLTTKLLRGRLYGL